MLAQNVMSKSYPLSLRRKSVKVGVPFMIVMAVGGFVYSPPPNAFLCLAVLAGVIYGIVDALGFLDRKWPGAIAVFLLVMFSAATRDRFLPKLEAGEKLLYSFQFVALSLLVAIIVVWVVEVVERRYHREPPLGLTSETSPRPPPALS